MVTCATVMKSLLVAAVVVVLSGQGSAAQKFADCCTNVDRREITEPILDFYMQRKSGSCVNAIIFQTETGYYCSKIDAPWVRTKIQELRKKARTTSLLELITSSSSPPSTAPPSSTMERTTGMRSTQHTVQ
ncbi:hypothetical protein N1851_018855 [Merluccius polli]|uniref:Chemokine interleukin-8-like domain-containing protein n=1 Tax=Merluccius polli TaxID=89951 RepID=A0AA47NY02_MERPO|nr:hypothetical protein N1851_018851 [Merluccius polli]KAK0143031.1 hypothetical protein N1851_018855 [Merluccius polli]